MQQIALDLGLAPSATFANFCPGANLAALQHLQLWVGKPGTQLRSPLPMYLWGVAGSGKTHLLQAVRQALLAQGASVGWLAPDVQVPAAFDATWSAVLLDDVQAFNSAQQQQAFGWFIHAQSQQRAVLAAGLQPPADLQLRDDLRSRLAWGHVFQLHALAESERRAVLLQGAAARGLVLSDEVMNYLLSRFSRDLASLMALLDQIDTYALQTQRAVTIALIKSMMDNA